jgi:DNA replication protein DnaC
MNAQTIEKVKQMKLYGIERAYNQVFESGTSQGLTFDELLAILIDAEYDERYNRKLERYIKTANLKQKASVDMVDFNTHRNLDKNLLVKLQMCQWVEKGRDILLTGPTGVGKSFVACALGYHACTNGLSTIYVTANKLFDKLMYAKADGSYPREIKKILKCDLLIIDDFGLKALDTASRNMLLEIIDDRHSIKSTIVTSQVPLKQWFEAIGDSVVADAVMDRLVNGAYRIEMQGESMRKMMTKS